MKQDHNLVWSNTHADGSITIGFTKKCITELLPECFHVMQADSQAVREKGPMLVLETNDGLESIKSPFTGRISYFNPKARNYPDKIVEEDTILTILPKGVEEKKPEKVKIPPYGGQAGIQFFDINPGFVVPVGDALAVPPPNPRVQERAAEQGLINRIHELQAEQQRHAEALGLARMEGEGLGDWIDRRNRV